MVSMIIGDGEQRIVTTIEVAAGKATRREVQRLIDARVRAFAEAESASPETLLTAMPVVVVSHKAFVQRLVAA